MKKIIANSIFLLVLFFNAISFGQEKQIFIKIKSNFPEDVNPIFKTKMDSVLNSMQDDFNKESKLLKFKVGNAEATQTLELNFTKVKIISKRGKKSAYWINGIGLTAIPLATVSMGLSMPIMITYFPRNFVKSTLNLPTDLAINKNEIKIKIRTGALFVQDEKMINKLTKKYALKVYKELKKLDERL